MRTRNVLLFIVSSGVAFIVFAAIALGIQATGLVRMNASRPLTPATSTVSIPVVRNTPMPLPPNATLIPTFTPIPNYLEYDWQTFLTQNDSQQQQWASLNIDDYHLVVELNSAWSGQTVTIEVRDGEIVQSSVACRANNECGSWNVEDYSVAGLFDEVRNLHRYTLDMEAAVIPEVTYDATYHFPTRILFSPRNITDSHFIYEVLSFTPLP
jgi:hypothetical protein